MRPRPWHLLRVCMCRRLHVSLQFKHGLSGSAGAGWSLCSAVPWHGVILGTDQTSLAPPCMWKGAGGSSPTPNYALMEVPLLAVFDQEFWSRLRKSSCYLKHKICSVSAATSRAEGGSREKPQSITCVSFCLLTKGSSS